MLCKQTAFTCIELLQTFTPAPLMQVAKWSGAQVTQAFTELKSQGTLFACRCNDPWYEDAKLLFSDLTSSTFSDSVPAVHVWEPCTQRVRQAVLPDLDLDLANMRAAFCTAASLLAQARLHVRRERAAQDEHDEQNEQEEHEQVRNVRQRLAAEHGAAGQADADAIVAGPSAPGAGEGSVAGSAAPADSIMRDDVAE